VVEQKDIQEYQTVILAAFLHDIGKLLGRGDFKILDTGQHPKFSADFVSTYRDLFAKATNADLLKELVQKHHENSKAFPPDFLVQSIQDNHIKTLATLVSKADNLASSERGEASEQYQDYKETPLCSVLERLDIQTGEELRLRFHPRQLPPTTNSPAMQNAIFAAEFTKYGPEEMNKLIRDGFGDSFKKFAKNAKIATDFDALANHLTNLVYIHTWCIPSNTQEEVPDVSLFDHLKVSAAIAACLYQYHSHTNTLDEKTLKKAGQNRFLLVTGDISGIQSYIFGITKAAGGVARKLRARSLFVQLCTEVAAHKILHKLQLPSWNLIMNSGGNFFLLLPNTPGATKLLEDTQRETDFWFMDKLNGELSLNLAWSNFGDDGFKGFSSVVTEVKESLSRKKQRRFTSVIQENGSWKTAGFVRQVSFRARESASHAASSQL